VPPTEPPVRAGAHEVDSLLPRVEAAEAHFNACHPLPGRESQPPPGPPPADMASLVALAAALAAVAVRGERRHGQASRRAGPLVGRSPPLSPPTASPPCMQEVGFGDGVGAHRQQLAPSELRGGVLTASSTLRSPSSPAAELRAYQLPPPLSSERHTHFRAGLRGLASPPSPLHNPPSAPALVAPQAETRLVPELNDQPTRQPAAEHLQIDAMPAQQGAAPSRSSGTPARLALVAARAEMAAAAAAVAEAEHDERALRRSLAAAYASAREHQVQRTAVQLVQSTNGW
jgi:hypothetical protein